MRNIEAEPNYLITLPKRGLKVVAPEHTQRVMAKARENKLYGTRFSEEEKQNLWPETEKARIWLMKKCGTLAKRYPTTKEGNEFMKNVDYGRREELFNTAKGLTSEIISSWKSINNEKEIAVILFGSVAKGLVKRTEHPDPSNIDIAVIGDISREEREKLLDEIRPHRHRIQEWILERVPFINSHERNPGNVGVIIQNIEKLKKDNFEPAKNYIASGAVSLYDSEGIWQNLELQALLSASEKMNRNKNHKLPKREVVYSI